MIQLERLTVALPGFAVKDIDRPDTAYHPFMALSDKIKVYNY